MSHIDTVNAELKSFTSLLEAPVPSFERSSPSWLDRAIVALGASQVVAALVVLGGAL